MLEKFESQEWQKIFSNEEQLKAINDLENDKILFFPFLNFNLNPSEKSYLSPEYADPHAKNISYVNQKLWGVVHLTDGQHDELKALLARFSYYAKTLVKNILPAYSADIITGRTSLRPVQICNRKISARKDDKRLHVDAFPSAPNQGKRILRVFSNVNPNGEARLWRVGEPFIDVARYFLPRLNKPIAGAARLLRFARITKSYRTAYDHYMLQLHDKMKADDQYQEQAKQQQISFPAASTWIVQTDSVSHAAMRGQHVLEQTFYLPVSAMQNETQSPLKILEKLLHQTLV